MSLEELAEHKNIANVSAIFRSKVVAVKAIQGIIVLDEFIRWSENKKKKKLISPTRMSAFFAASRKSSILRSKEIDWSIEKLSKVISRKMWEAFWEEHPNMQRLELNVVLGLTQKETATLIAELTNEKPNLIVKELQHG
jgi:hypothetical protein